MERRNLIDRGLGDRPVARMRFVCSECRSVPNRVRNQRITPAADPVRADPEVPVAVDRVHFSKGCCFVAGFVAPFDLLPHAEL